MNAENGESDCGNGQRFCCGECALATGKGLPLLPPKVDRRESQLGSD